MRFSTAEFEVTSLFSHGSFQVVPHEQCWNGVCFPGTTFDVGLQTIGTQLNALWPSSTFNGVTYPGLVIDGNLAVTGPQGTVPSLPAGQGSVSASFPVTLTGFLSIYSDPSRTVSLANTEVFGSGSVSILFTSSKRPASGLDERTTSSATGWIRCRNLLR